jgi:uncharacterized membrane protein HdeD (DUF308 family)
VAGVVAVAWPGLTVWGLAITVGVGLIVGGIGKLADAMLAGGIERLIAGVSGDASLVIGVLALRWPAVTVLVIAVLVGIRTVLFGLALVMAAFWLRGGAVPGRARRWRWPWRVRLVGAVAASVLAAGGVAASVAIHRAAPEAPGAFHRPPPLPAGPARHDHLLSRLHLEDRQCGHGGFVGGLAPHRQPPRVHRRMMTRECFGRSRRASPAWL